MKNTNGSTNTQSGKNSKPDDLSWLQEKRLAEHIEKNLLEEYSFIAEVTFKKIIERSGISSAAASLLLPKFKKYDMQCKAFQIAKQAVEGCQ